MMDKKFVNEAQEPHKLSPIATIYGCYPEKFGVPRQAGLVTAATAMVKLLAGFNTPDFIRGLEAYSHLWLIFGFHKNQWNGEGLVRPQRLGGNKKMGVFATRSSFRPNGLGLSAVEIVAIDALAGEITVKGQDLMDGTPIYDVKPYIPFVDVIPAAISDFAPSAPIPVPVVFSEKAENTLIAMLATPALKALIIEVIGQNPTPVFHEDYARIYGVSLYHYNIQFKKHLAGFMVMAIETEKLF